MRNIFRTPSSLPKKQHPLYPIEQALSPLEKIRRTTANIKGYFNKRFKKSMEVDTPEEMVAEVVTMDSPKEQYLFTKPQKQVFVIDMKVDGEDKGEEEIKEKSPNEHIQTDKKRKIIDIHERIERNGEKYLKNQQGELLGVLVSTGDDLLEKGFAKAFHTLNKELAEVGDRQWRIDQRRYINTQIQHVLEYRNDLGHLRKAAWQGLEVISMTKENIVKKQSEEYGVVAAEVKVTLMQLVEDMVLLEKGNQHRFMDNFEIYRERLERWAHISLDDGKSVILEKLRDLLAKYGYSFDKNMNRRHLYTMALSRLESRGLYGRDDVRDNLEDIALPVSLLQELHQRRTPGSPIVFNKKNPLPVVSVQLLARMLMSPRSSWKQGEASVGNDSQRDWRMAA